MSKQLKNYIGSIRLCKSINHHKAERKDRAFNPPFLFTPKPFLMDKLSGNLIKIKLKCDLGNLDGETTEECYSAVEQFTMEDLINHNN